MSSAGRAGTVVWALAVLLAAAIVARATYVADLSAFLPRAPTAAQRLLVEQLRAGPAVHLIMLAIEGGEPETRAQLSLQLAARLRADPAFAAVNNGDAAQLQRDREFLLAHRYLLADDVTPQRFTVDGLHAAIGDSLDALAAPEGLLLKPLFPRDPTGELLAILDSLGPGAAPHTDGGVWSSPSGARALLLVQTRAAGSDTDAQQAACEAIRRAFAAAVTALPAAQRAAPRLLMSGPPVFAVESRAIVKQEVLRLSAVSAVLITVLLLAVYRSLPALVLTLVPVLSGALAGVAAVALGFGAVHGITLGFGVTLIGEAVDYSIYLFIQSGGDFRRTVWPTIRLGVLTSICGFAALLPSAFPGLAQLGLYSIAGLVAAALVTRFVLPHWAQGVRSVRDLSAAGEKLVRALAGLQRRRAAAALALLALAAAAVLYLQRGALFSRELAALNPVPLAAQRLDDELRADAGAPDVRYIAIASGTDREAALAAAQRLSGRLSPLVDAGVIGSFQSPTRYLPPRAVQLARQASLPTEGELRARLAAALAGLPVKPGVLEPFVADVAAARRGATLTEADLAGTSLAAATDALLVHTSAGWSALLPVAVSDGDLAPGALARLRAAVAAQDGAPLLDLKAEADALYGGYLAAAGRLALLGLAAIVVLLAVALRSAARVARVVAPLVLAVLTVAALLVVTHHRLTILHVVGMLLIVAVGSNYALFFDRSSARPYEGSVPRTLASLGVANAATVIAFGVLAFSRVPVLADLGSTVAPGTLLALWFSGLLARPAAAGRA